MYRTLLNLIDAEVSGAATKNLVTTISQWHRIQASPMYREAASWLHATLRGWGLASELESYPARFGVRAWAEPMFQEWWCEEATLELVEPGQPPRRLADYRAVPLSLLPRSAPADGEYELVVVAGGERTEHYEGLDVRGKLVLTKSMPMAVHHLAIERFGAAGVIFDGMRSVPEVCPPGDLPDDIQYASWWWWGDEARAFGFALSPRAGAELRRAAEARARDGKPPLRLRARVASHFADGAIEAVTAHIPGETDEEVLVVGHLCHPAPFANDNASGAAAVMEAARALHRLIADGQIAPPRRGIRFLWVPEMTGTYAYLAGHADRLPRTLAGLNLDMVGEDQEQCGSSWMLVRTPEAMPSYVSDLLEMLREYFFSQSHSFAGNGDFPLFRHCVVPYANGSDHYIMADPTVGIPTPMLIQWPDRFYHTTADTLEKVSPATLQRAVTLAATYAYFIAGAGAPEVAWLAREMTARFEARLARELQGAVTEALSGEPHRGPSWEDRMSFRLYMHHGALESLRRLDPQFDPRPAYDNARAVADLIWARSRDVLADRRAERPSLPEEQARRVPQRRYPGPVSLRSQLALVGPELREQARDLMERHSAFLGLDADLALYWADGKRSLGDILDLLELESGTRNPEALLEYFDLLAQFELLSWA